MVSSHLLSISAISTLATVIAFPHLAEAQHVSNEIIEGYPIHILRRLDAAEERLSKALNLTRPSSEFLAVVDSTRRWTPGQTLKIAFKGGNATLHKAIADTAREWTEYANIEFDFGYDDNTKQYRSWSDSDQQYAADIRIAFDGDGYWSAVGNASIKPSIFKSNEASMSLADFDKKLPDHWKGTVLHEFGHALGAKHEHQHPKGGCDYIWEPEPGYVYKVDANDQYIPDDNGRSPGIYLKYGGKPNCWSRLRVDGNMRPLSGSTLESSNFDKTSIMMYSIKPYLFTLRTKSPCYIDERSQSLSETDKEWIAKMYPLDEEKKGDAIAEQKKLFDVLAGSKELTKGERIYYRSHIRALPRF